MAPNWSLCLSLTSFPGPHHSDLSEAQIKSCCCSVGKSFPTLCVPMDPSTPDSPVLRSFQEFAQIHVHWASEAISSSAAPFSFCIQSFPASGSFPMSWLFTSGGQSINTPFLQLHNIHAFHYWCNGHELGQTPGDGGGQGGLVCCSPQGCEESDTTWETEHKYTYI